MLDLHAIQRLLDAPAPHPEVLGENIPVSPAFLRQVHAELSAARKPPYLALMDGAYREPRSLGRAVPPSHRG